ncbi:hypothetical protein SAMD00019534_105760 [Acytostelium subglobosum LB1]|uniref:hypothetical protein n=1 Tax=Acytostelium subglobosum LB1 TaxID=1410327 RepID=UPI00064495CE|nr:hypothetical protein SAMD00019534_105760 [Acytostelium subglobosum LB1]GAM27401.1 hypothetical protein SAMD00019534_105760 [Acytostelium subglobosum LB1]|eukprot:XP_012749466.1 hypothetical protein SAMD00019534_105760 [Acytostelium subglobosum LB1]
MILVSIPNVINYNIHLYGNSYEIKVRKLDEYRSVVIVNKNLYRTNFHQTLNPDDFQLSAHFFTLDSFGAKQTMMLRTEVESLKELVNGLNKQLAESKETNANLLHALAAKDEMIPHHNQVHDVSEKSTGVTRTKRPLLEHERDRSKDKKSRK